MGMNVPHEDAKDMRCPLGVATFCRASRCMGWQWAEVRDPATSGFYVRTKPSMTHGHCRLIEEGCRCRGR